MESREINNLYEFEGFELDPAHRQLLHQGAPVELPRIAFNLLLILVESAGHLKTRDELFDALWPNTIVEKNSLSWYVSVLRKALGDEGKTSRFIQTVRGQGYRFIAPVETVSPTLKVRDEANSPRSARKKRPFIVAGIACVVAIIVVAIVLSWRHMHGAPPVPARSIAVLPFENLSNHPGNAYFAAGIQDTILTKLSSIGDLKVISRTSTANYPSHPENLTTIARELGVATVLEGSVQKVGNQVLINVQLIAGSGGR